MSEPKPTPKEFLIELAIKADDSGLLALINQMSESQAAAMVIRLQQEHFPDMTPTDESK